MKVELIVAAYFAVNAVYVGAHLTPHTPKTSIVHHIDVPGTYARPLPREHPMPAYG